MRVVETGGGPLAPSTGVPVAMGLFIRGRIRPERANPVNRALLWLYRPVLLRVLA